MANVGVNAGKAFSILPEGRQVLKVTKVDYKEKFQKIEIQFINKDGILHTERFMLGNKNGLKVFSYLAHTILNNWGSDSIETDDLIGKFISVEVVHNEVESTKIEGEYVTFANIRSYQPATEFEDDSNDEDDDFDLPDDLEDALN